MYIVTVQGVCSSSSQVVAMATGGFTTFRGMYRQLLSNIHYVIMLLTIKSPTYYTIQITIIIMYNHTSINLFMYNYTCTCTVHTLHMM